MFEIITLILFVLLIVTLIVVLGFIYFYSKKQRLLREKAMNEIEVNTREIINDAGIQQDAFWTDNNLLKERTALSINETESSVVIVNFPSASDFKSGRKVADIQKVNFEDIIEVKVISNSKTIKATSKEVELDDVSIDESIQKMSLEIVTNHVSHPVIEVVFYVSKITELQAGTPEHNEIREKINYWYEKLAVLLQK